MQTPIQLVVFDMAGTTVQDQHEVEKCFAQACAETGLPVSENRILSLQGYSKIEVFRLLWEEKIGKEHPEYQENVFVSYDTFTYILESHYRTQPVFPTEGCLETFQFLRENNIKIALTTGFYRKVTNFILDKLGWLEGLDSSYVNTTGNAFIDVSIASDEVEKGRPEPFMIYRAMEKLGIDEKKAVINVGDTPSDLQSGKKAGVRLSLGVTNGTHTHEQLQKYPNDGFLRHLGELPVIIQSFA
jgi:phosphonatase-like hydrolase